MTRLYLVRRPILRHSLGVGAEDIVRDNVGLRAAVALIAQAAVTAAARGHSTSGIALHSHCL